MLDSKIVKNRMRFEEEKVGCSSTGQIDKTKDFQYKAYQGLSVSYTHCVPEAGATNRHGSYPFRI